MKLHACPDGEKIFFEPSTATPNGVVAKEVRVTRQFFSMSPMPSLKNKAHPETSGDLLSAEI
jgi:hypothetical protein